MRDAPVTGAAADIAAYFDRLWPIMRSITGQGVRLTHDILSELVPLERMEIPSGSRCFDWEVPKEWVVREAYLVTPDGRRILDVAENTLHLVNYSVPFRGRLSREDLDAHLHSIPDLPDAVPYVTSYYAPMWGFCLPHRMREGLPDGEYEVVVDTDHVDGSMTISEAVLPGEEPGEILISSYTCHPSMANNELSGPLAAAFLYRRLAGVDKRRLTYRFVFLPETIGSIAYLSLRGDHLKDTLVAGYVLTCVGDDSPITYKRSRRGDTPADRAAAWSLSRREGAAPRLMDFFPFGSDERQYCSPGFNLPVGVLARSWPGTFDEYHTSLDNRNFISFEVIADSVDALFDVCQTVERNRTYHNLCPYGEPNLGKRNLMPTEGAGRERREFVDAIKWVLNLSDGAHDLLSIAEKSGIALETLDRAATAGLEAGLLRAADRLRAPVDKTKGPCAE